MSVEGNALLKLEYYPNDLVEESDPDPAATFESDNTADPFNDLTKRLGLPYEPLYVFHDNDGMGNLRYDVWAYDDSSCRVNLGTAILVFP